MQLPSEFFLSTLGHAVITHLVWCCQRSGLVARRHFLYAANPQKFVRNQPVVALRADTETAGVGRHKTWATHPEHNRRIALPGIALPLGCRVSAAGSLGGACRRRALAGCARCQCCTRAARVICSGQALLRVRPWTSRGMPMVPSAVFCAKAGRPH